MRQTTQRKTTQTQEKAKRKRGGSKQHQTGQKAAKRAEPTEEKGRGEDGKERAPGKAAETGGKKAGACSSNGVLKGVLDHPRANTSVQERGAPDQHPDTRRERPAEH